MAIRLDTRSADFAGKFRAFLDGKRETSADVEAAVRAIIADVIARGDRALQEYTLKFDRLDLDRSGIKVTPEETAAALRDCAPAALDALKLARDRIEVFHRRQMPRDDSFTDPLGVELGSRWTAIDAVGLYVPGGTAAYPSSVLMNAVPAKVAGVPRIVMVVPAPGGVLNPLVLAAAKLAGVDEIYRIGGAQAIAALAYGTASIAPVAKIVGPGNAYVAAAKRLVDIGASRNRDLFARERKGHRLDHGGASIDSEQDIASHGRGFAVAARAKGKIMRLRAHARLPRPCSRRTRADPMRRLRTACYRPLSQESARV